MRKLTLAALAGATVAGGALAGCASDPYYDYASRDPYYDRGYHGPVYAPGYAYSDSSVALSVLGSLIGDPYVSRVPVDRYGPNPHGMIAPDGHRITCRLRTSYDSYYGGRITRRVCR